jgi:Cu2+-containing amine oxidase
LLQDSITNFISCSQAGSGSNIQVQGNVINWSNFRFHVRYDQRVGIIVSNVTYNDAGVQRDIMYQGDVDEIFVPYEVGRPKPVFPILSSGRVSGDWIMIALWMRRKLEARRVLDPRFS